MHKEASVPALPLNGVLAAKVIRKRIKGRIAALSQAEKEDGGAVGESGRVPGLGIVMANGCVCIYCCQSMDVVEA